MAKPKPSRPLLALVALTHIVVTALTWRDLRRRADDEVRGTKRWWRAASAVNTGGSVLYFLVGRRR